MLTEEQSEWRGTASELIQKLQLEIQPNVLTRKLNISVERLCIEHEIHYESIRGHSGRMIILKRQPKKEGEDDKKGIMQEDC